MRLILWLCEDQVHCQTSRVTTCTAGEQNLDSEEIFWTERTSWKMKLFLKGKIFLKNVLERGNSAESGNIWKIWFTYGEFDFVEVKI